MFFMEPEGLVLCLKDSTTGPCPARYVWSSCFDCATFWCHYY